MIHSVDALLQQARQFGHSAVPHLATGIPDDIEHLALDVDPQAIVNKYWSKLSLWSRSRLRQRISYGRFKTTIEGTTYLFDADDRSEIVFGLARQFGEAGATPVETAAVVMATPFWKERVGGGKRENIRTLLGKVYSSIELPETNPEDLILEYPSNWSGLPVPTRKWLWDDWIPMGQVTLLYGDGGTGKTSVALMLAAAVVCEKQFLGSDVRSGRACAFLAENRRDDTHITLDAICCHYDLDLSDFSDRLAIASRGGFNNVLMAFVRDIGESTKLFEELLRQLVEFKPILVVIDTAADVFDGNENVRNQVRRFMNECCLRIARDTGAAVVLCAHPSLTGLQSGEGTSGSTAWHNSARARLNLKREIVQGFEADPDIRVLTAMKENFARKGSEIKMRYRDGVFVPIDPRETRAAASKAEVAVIAEIERAYTAGAAWNPNHQSAQFYIVPWMLQNLRLTSKVAREMIRRLLQQQKICLVLIDKRTHQKGLCSAKQANETTAKLRKNQS